MSSPDQIDSMEKYHAYLEKNYKCGVERFFSPTGVLKRFQKSVEVSSKKTREVVIAKSADDAALKLRSIVNGGEGVFDLSSEPGTGKTSVLPFKFPSKRVVVALPTPFDAWSAFQMATGKASLRLKGLTLGDKDSRVCYTDSYLAANMVLADFMEFDILIVDECDSGRGVTRFLADVGVKGKVVIRMSASHGRTESGPSRAFTVTEDNSLPDVRDGVKGFVDAAKQKMGKRSLVLLPDAQTAQGVAKEIPGARLVCSSSNLRVLAENVLDQTSDAIYVADDVCARGLNLNLDTLIDSQLIVEHGVLRNLSDAELYQRKGRVGRNKPGRYVSPGLPTIPLRESEADVLRSNVLRAIAGIEQEGPTPGHLSFRDADRLMDAEVEPITNHTFEPEAKPLGPRAPTPDGLARRRNSRSTSSRRHSSSTASSKESGSGSDSGVVSAPGWLQWMMPKDVVEEHRGKRYYVSGLSSPVRSPEVDTSGTLTYLVHSRRSSRELPIAESAPYAVASRRRAPLERQRASVTVPDPPPQVDLTELEYHMDWPSALRDCVLSGRELPTIVPPGNWRHTSVGGIGSDWVRRLEDLAVRELTFIESEFEIVCRAWNRMVSEAWVKRTPGLSSAHNLDRVEFCLRYFQSYFAMYS